VDSALGDNEHSFRVGATIRNNRSSRPNSLLEISIIMPSIGRDTHTPIRNNFWDTSFYLKPQNRCKTFSRSKQHSRLEKDQCLDVQNRAP